ncbi:hypothetical protein ACU4GD_13095 [Cupriavidus basilensis]
MFERGEQMRVIARPDHPLTRARSTGAARPGADDLDSSPRGQPDAAESRECVDAKAGADRCHGYRPDRVHSCRHRHGGNLRT